MATEPVSPETARAVRLFHREQQRRQLEAEGLLPPDIEPFRALGEAYGQAARCLMASVEALHLSGVWSGIVVDHAADYSWIALNNAEHYYRWQTLQGVTVAGLAAGGVNRRRSTIDPSVSLQHGR
jgi:hypothetical protein